MASFGNLETEVEPLATLMREHEEVHALVVQTQEALQEAIATPGDATLAGRAQERVRDLDAYLAVDLVTHIAKEEEVLFPALRGLTSDMDVVVTEMVEQHDEVRARAAAIEAALETVEASHQEVEEAKAQVSSEVAALDPSGTTPEAMANLLDAIKRLDWMLQGHFGDEEDDLFVPALDLLAPSTWAELAGQARALENR